MIHAIFEFFGKVADWCARLILKLYPMTPPRDFTDLEILNPTESTPSPVPTPTSPYTPPTAPQTPNTPSDSSKNTPTLNGQIMLGKFCDAITQMEGANPANNNPGNCRCSPVGYLPMYGHVTCNPHNFAVFPTLALGRLYLENMVHFKAHNHPTWTIYDFFAVYAPSSDQNDPKHYAEFVAKHCGVIPSTQLKDLFA